MSVRLVTSLGELIIKLYVKEAPIASCNFLKLCKLKYYHWCIFHHVEGDFIAQTGDPTGTGRGGQRYQAVLSNGEQVSSYFSDEICKSLKHNGKGILSMATKGKDKNASQFFITLTDRHLDYLDGLNTIFGKVESGLDVLDAINKAICDKEGRPLIDIFIKHAIVLEDPFPNPSNFPRIDRSPPPSRIFTEMRRPDPKDAIGASEDLERLTPEELAMRRMKEEARSAAITLEMLGDRPSVDMKAPENVLFVCKLNPITESEDLATIFSRFGPVLSCKVIKDRKSDVSLGYAFIEYGTKEACEEAYKKMDNVLIDDRRIKVDFSQSISNHHHHHHHSQLQDTKRDRNYYNDRNETRKSRDRNYHDYDYDDNRGRHHDYRDRKRSRSRDRRR